MRPSEHTRFGWVSRVLLSAWMLAPAGMTVPAPLARGAEIILKDGSMLQGRMAAIPSMTGDPNTTVPGATPVVLMNDELRRVYVSTRNIDEVPEGNSMVRQRPKFIIKQPVPRNAAMVATVGPPIKIEKFDDFGRRNYTMATSNGPVTITQGIVEITPYYTRVKAISKASRKPYRWDMRIATSSIPRETLDRILAKQPAAGTFAFQLQVAQLYIGMERYKDARQLLDAIVKKFPGQVNQAFQRVRRDLRQSQARRLLVEVRVRADARQHRLAFTMLNQFPADGVAGEILQEVQEMLDSRKSQRALGVQILKLLDADIKALPTDLARQAQPIQKEIVKELYLNTLNRMAAYVNLAERDKVDPEAKVARAISGWLVGANGATENFPVAVSLFKVRNLVRRYFNEELKIERDLIIRQMSSLEGSTPDRVAQILVNMTPPKNTEPQETPGSFELSVPGIPGQASSTYYVQLPPEYDPYHKYPAIVTLNGSGTTPQQQIDWWAGSVDDKGVRRGQATRNGYIVIAPTWRRDHQKEFEFSLREHIAVLNALRDASRRFAIDTDRVFLSGHSMGGNAAWDIGVAHPDLWAGVIPIVATCAKFINRYSDNARYVPMYLVGGELDGNKLGTNALSLNRYMIRGYDTRVVEFLGRGHEHFSDEIHHLFDWMGRNHRDFFPKEFNCVTMRPWDNYFWWVELAQMPPRVMIDPSAWPPRRGVVAMKIKASQLATNGLRITSGAEITTVWLSPEMVDFDKPIDLIVNRKTYKFRISPIKPSLQTLLEDVRTRGDRQHPFWAKATFGGKQTQVSFDGAPLSKR